MSGDEDIRRYSRAQIEEMLKQGLSETRPDAPEYEVGEEFWANARIVHLRGHKSSIHLRLDSDVLQWFRDGGKGHLSRMNAALREYMETHKTKAG